MHRCPLADSCSGQFKSHAGLLKHWSRLHARCHGPLHPPTSSSIASASGSALEASALEVSGQEPPSESVAGSPSDVAKTAMAHLDEMKFRHYSTDADVARVKSMVRDCLESAITAGGGPSSMATNIVSAFDKINSTRRETTARSKASSRTCPPLQVYPRLLGLRTSGKRKKNMGNEAYAYDTRWEEVLEREFAYDPQLITEVILAHEHWLRRSKEIRKAGWRDPNRKFSDVCDGQVWQEHPCLGDPNYDGPTRLAFEAYCDDVDIPNPIGLAAGHHKLYLSFFVLLNRPPKTRATLRSIHLATICLASDFGAFGPRKVIDGDGFDNSVGGTMRRFDAVVSLRTPPSSGMTSLCARGWLAVWTADGLAQGEVYGTNASFSKAINPCNLCEDLDQRSPSKRKPCGFLVCECEPASEGHASHRHDCSCHFQLRTPQRDAVRAQRTLSARELQSLGIVTLDHGFVKNPYFHVAHGGPKEPMHAVYEGRTKHLSAHTCWSIVKSGLASAAQLRSAAQSFDWSPGDTSGFFRPDYIPESIFVSTKVFQPDGSWVWGPHKTAKLPFSAAGMVTFTVMSIPFFQQFIPASWTLASSPQWWRAWVLHVNAACATLCFHFTFADLLRIESLIVDSERAIAAHPPYADTWIPKAHWILHIAHDMFRFGPSRLLWVFLKEMKNAAFKRACKRSNFHNPVKSTAIFWCQQSDWQCQHADVARCSCFHSDANVIIQGVISDFPDSKPVALLQERGRISSHTTVAFLSALDFHGIVVRLNTGVLYGGSLYHVARLITYEAQYVVYMHLLTAEVCVNSFGQRVVRPPFQLSSSHLVSLHAGTDLTPVYLVPNGDVTTVIVRV